VVITNEGTYTITSSSSINLSSLQIGGASGTQSLIVTGGILTATVANAGAGAEVVLQGGAISGGWTIAPAAELSLKGASWSSLTLVNDGTINWVEGTVLCNAASPVLVTNRGEWLISCST